MQKTIIITPELSGQRIDALCAKRLPQLSRSRWTKHGSFLCDGVPKAGKAKAREGQKWIVSCPEESPLSGNVEPWDFPLTLLAESDSWVVIEKPEGIAVHPSVSDPTQQTIINALLHHFGKNLSENFDEIEGRAIPRPGLVHRLDKTTSGVLLIAKTNQAHKYFQDHWSECEKTYDAIVTGRPPKKGKIEGAIFRDPEDRKKMAISKNEKAKSATSLFETLHHHNGLAHLAVKILTGRTHQIRVHLSSIGFPILGDVLYGGEASERIFLHARSLSFPDPDKGGEVREVVSETPEGFRKKC